MRQNITYQLRIFHQKQHLNQEQNSFEYVLHLWYELKRIISQWVDSEAVASDDDERLEDDGNQKNKHRDRGQKDDDRPP